MSWINIQYSSLYLRLELSTCFAPYVMITFLLNARILCLQIVDELGLPYRPTQTSLKIKNLTNSILSIQPSLCLPSLILSLAPGIPCEAEQEASRLVLVLLEQLLALLLALYGIVLVVLVAQSIEAAAPQHRQSDTYQYDAMPCHGMLCYDIKRDLWIHWLLKNFSCPQNLCHWSKNIQDTVCAGWGWHPPLSGWKPSTQGLVSISLAMAHKLKPNCKLQVTSMMNTSITTNTAWCVITLVLQQDLNCPPTAPSGLDKAFARPLAGDSPKDIHLGGACLTSTGL